MSGHRPHHCGSFLYRTTAVESVEYRAIFEASPDGCLVVDRSGTIRAANPRVQELFGWAPEELEGQKVEVLVPEMHREAHSGHRTRFVADPHNRPMGVGLDLRGRRRDGSTFPVEISLSPWAADDSDLRVICTVRDVTEYTRLRNFSEGALQATEEERRRIARELHDDTAQRLATLILRVRRLAEERDPLKRSLLHEEIREEIVDAAEGVKRMARGLRPPEIEELGLALAITAHVRSLREAARFDVQTELGVVDHALNVTAKLALYRIVQEALSNARRYSGEGGAKVRLFLEDGTVVAEISDEGRGFLQSQALEAGGGLGLVGMKERAAMVGGRLTIDSEPGEGTRVRVTVPVLGWEKRDG
jgi:PAS domain S-box-containing protein